MNIYVGNLPFGIKQDELKSVFEEYGKVSSATIIMDRETGRSKGFGFVDMPDNTEAQKAIDNINGADLQGRTLMVNVARPKK